MTLFTESVPEQSGHHSPWPVALTNHGATEQNRTAAFVEAYMVEDRLLRCAKGSVDCLASVNHFAGHLDLRLLLTLMPPIPWTTPPKALTIQIFHVLGESVNPFSMVCFRRLRAQSPGHLDTAAPRIVPLRCHRLFPCG